MRALYLQGPGQITYETVDDPELTSPDDVIVQTTLCGLCGSDLHAYHTGSSKGAYCIGHEAVGEVVEVGRNVKKFKPGDRVTVPGAIGCGACEPCRAGITTLCRTFPVFQIYGQGFEGIGGCQAEAVVVPRADADNLYHLPAGISDDVGVFLTDNLATAWYAGRRARVGPGDVVAVIGLGPVGLQAVVSAFAQGAERVIALDLVEARRAQAARLGAEVVDADDVLAAVREMTGGRGPDVVIDANGGPVTSPMAVRMAGKGGRVSIVGATEVHDFEFPVFDIMFKNLELHAGVCPIQQQVPELFRAIEDGRISTAALEELVTHRMPLSKGAEAYALFDARSEGVMKVMLDARI